MRRVLFAPILWYKNIIIQQLNNINITFTFNTFQMQQQQYGIILLNLSSKVERKRVTITITKQMTLKWLREQVKQHFQIKDEGFELIFKQKGDRQVVLEQSSLSLFLDNCHLYKIVKITQFNDFKDQVVRDLIYDNKQIDQSGTYIIQNNNRNSHDISKQDLQDIPKTSNFNQFHSFLADDFHKILPTLEGICNVQKVKVEALEQQKVKQYISKLKFPQCN